MAQTLQRARLVSLAEVITGAPAEHVLATGFSARLTGPLVGGDVADQAVVTGTVGERTVVVELEGGERRLARLPDVLVDPEAMEWVRVGRPPRGRWAGKHPDEDVAKELEEQRRASGRRARQDQERRQRPDAGARPVPAPTEAGDGVVEPSMPAAAANNPAGEVLDDQVGGDVDAVRPQVDADRPVEPAQGEGTTPAGRTKACAPALSSPPAAPGPVTTSLSDLAPSPSVGEGAGVVAGAVELDGISPAPGAEEGGEGARSCGRCGGRLRRDSRDGTCTRCRSICPACGGEKAAPAARCRACSRAATAGPEPQSLHQVESAEAVDVADPVDVAGGGGPRDALSDDRGPAACAEDSGQRACESCGRGIPGHNRSGVCMLCRSRCPGCGGIKTAQADRCWRCAGQVRGAVEPEVPAADLGHAEPAGRTAPAVDEHRVPLEEGAPAGVATSADDQVVGESEADVAEVVEPRLCERCGTQLPRHNQLGVCTRCQTTCPTCGGTKAAQAERCRACRSEAPGLAVEALETAQAFEDLPELVRDMHEQFATLARYTRDLEDELAALRAAERRRRRGERLTRQRGRS